MKNILSIFTYLFLLIIVIAGCSQTKQYTPQPIGTQYNLSGMPADIVRVQVNDLRAEREKETCDDFSWHHALMCWNFHGD